MKQEKNSRVVRFWTAMAIGALAGVGAGLYLRAALKGDGGEMNGLLSRIRPGTEAVQSEQLNAAMKYVRALQEGDWDSAIDRTAWMQERLQYVSAKSGSPAAEPDARSALRRQLAERTAQGNQLLPEGVEDQYVFTPTSTVVYLGSDDGVEELEAPIAARIWLEVTYASRSRALLDQDALPIRKIRVAANVSADGMILKAGIVGNLEIDWDSISNDWGSAPGVE